MDRVSADRNCQNLRMVDDDRSTVWNQMELRWSADDLMIENEHVEDASFVFLLLFLSFVMLLFVPQFFSGALLQFRLSIARMLCHGCDCYCDMHRHRLWEEGEEEEIKAIQLLLWEWVEWMKD